MRVVTAEFIWNSVRPAEGDENKKDGCSNGTLTRVDLSWSSDRDTRSMFACVYFQK